MYVLFIFFKKKQNQSELDNESTMDQNPNLKNPIAVELKTNPYQTDATISPGVLEFQERLLRDKLAPELYTLIMRLQRKSAWIDPNVFNDQSSSSQTQSTLKSILDHKANAVSTYLAEKSLKMNAAVGNAEVDEDANPGVHLVFPLLPPHWASYSLHFTPLLDFVKFLCEV